MKNENRKIARELLKIAKELTRQSSGLATGTWNDGLVEGVWMDDDDGRTYETRGGGQRSGTATEHGEYHDFTGNIRFGDIRGRVRNASFLLSKTKGVTFADGTWEDGDFRGEFQEGTFKKGNFNGGTFVGGTFADGNFNDGIFKNGDFAGGVFAGTWNGGTWVDGIFEGKGKDPSEHRIARRRKPSRVSSRRSPSRYASRSRRASSMADSEGFYRNFTGRIEWGNNIGRVRRATFELTPDFSVIFHEGTWLDGDWEDGEWLNGTWNKGTFNDGTWYGGTWIEGSFYGDDKSDNSDGPTY